MRISIANLALKNLRRKFVRALVLLLSVAVVTGALLGASVFMTGMKTALRIGTYRLGADILVVPEKYEAQARTALLAGEPTSFYMSRSVLDKVKAVDGVKDATAQLFIKPASFSCCFSVDTFLIAFDPATDFTITPWLKKNLKRPLADNEIITGREVPVIVGDEIPFYGTLFHVAGTLEPTGMKFFDRSVFMSMDAGYRMAEDSVKKSMAPIHIARDQISAVLVRVSDNTTPDRVAIRIEHDIDGVKALASDQVVNVVRTQLNGLMKGIFIISCVLWALALLMLGFAFYMIVNERQRELGLLRAMGARKMQIFRLIISEAVLLSGAGGILGLLLASALVYLFKDFILHSLKLPYLLPGSGAIGALVAGALVFSVMTGLLASVLPAYAASRMEPYEAIRKGE